MRKKGLLVLLSGPSGVGKNTLLRYVLAQLPAFRQLPTATTRLRRSDEMEGREHFFVSDEQFQEYIASGSFIEWQVIHGYRYGTLRASLEEDIATGGNYIADIDPVGAVRLKELYSNDVLLIFVLTTSLDLLEERIKKRGPISDEEMRTRLGRAQEEMAYASRCDHVITNDDLQTAASLLIGIITTERRKRDHSPDCVQTPPDSKQQSGRG